MSLFKNFSKVISQSALNNKKNLYQVWTCSTFNNPAHYYLGPNADLKDPYQLSVVAYHTVKKYQSDKALLDKCGVSGNDNLQSLRVRLVQDLATNEALLNQFVHDLTLIFKLNKFDLPIQNLIGSVYTFEHYKGSNVQFYEEYIFPAIRNKLQYASLSNLSDLVISLSNAKYFENKELWNSVLKHLRTRLEGNNAQWVKYNGWDLDAYESIDCSKWTWHNTENERLYEALTKGGPTGRIKHIWRTNWDNLKVSILNRFLYNDKKLGSRLDCFEDQVDQERLKAAINEAGHNGIDIGDVAEQINRPKVNA